MSQHSIVNLSEPLQAASERGNDDHAQHDCDVRVPSGQGENPAQTPAASRTVQDVTRDWVKLVGRAIADGSSVSAAEVEALAAELVSLVAQEHEQTRQRPTPPPGLDIDGEPAPFIAGRNPRTFTLTLTPPPDLRHIVEDLRDYMIGSRDATLARLVDRFDAALPPARPDLVQRETK